jgi:hypothetical protein
MFGGDFVCGSNRPDFPVVADGGCCIGAAVMDRCTCWQPLVTIAQRDPIPSHDPDTRHTPCADCAFRPDSPERTGDDRYHHASDDELAAVVAGSTPFYCHDGMARVVAYVHPSGATFPMPTDNYVPPIVDNVPFRGDGSPAFICAGWRARHDAVAGGT